MDIITAIILAFVLVTGNANTPVNPGERYSATICDSYYDNACQVKGYASYSELKPGTETCLHFEDNTVRCGYVTYDNQGWRFADD